MSDSHFPALIIFDVDGTLIENQGIDNNCFDEAFSEITEMVLTAAQWERFEEVTAQAIIHQALGDDYAGDLSSIKNRVRESYLAKLRTHHGIDPVSICAFAGAIDLIADLKKSADLRVAIATGCWRETAHFKLDVAGFDLADIPFACASDCYTRAEIIALAAERAGVPIERAVYVGDGIWDFRATRQLGIPFIGTGRKIDVLRQAGARHTLDELHINALLDVLGRIRKEEIRHPELVEGSASGK